jgi:hypothetical protein
VAKLEPCGIYNIAGDAHGAGEVDHVIARTPGATRKYYYRRREYGYWTPWEKIDLDIEGDPVVPVVWKDRLLLFWLHIIKQGPTSTKKATGGPTLNDVTYPPDPNMNVQVILCWSEYYNGKWQPAKTSNTEAPETYAQIAAGSPYPFDRTRIPIFVDEVDGGALRVMISYSTALRFYNTYGEPLHDVAWAPVSYVYPPAKERWIFTGTNDLSIQYIGVGNKPNTTRQIIKPPIDYRIVQTLHPVADVWAPPFFFRDARHVFYVSSTYTEVPLQVVQNFGFPTSPGGTGTISGPVTYGPATAGTTTKSAGNTFSSGLLAGNNAQFGGSGAAVQYLSEDANIQQAFASPALVSFNGQPIGPSGSVTNSAQ